MNDSSRSSPRPWGCFFDSRIFPCYHAVFPTPVGVFPTTVTGASPAARLPHARGGVSNRALGLLAVRLSSPRPWGCFQRVTGSPCRCHVFPTPVGVFPPDTATRFPFLCLPHARGGVSGSLDVGACLGESSPRPWGCFFFDNRYLIRSVVFPTPVGVFLWPHLWIRPSWRLPHARGGVSAIRADQVKAGQSSPRPWGCFCLMQAITAGNEVFPTPVGVFPAARLVSRCLPRLPHARGGVSPLAMHLGLFDWSSPRPWGCFELCSICFARSSVFPTPVGVFR